jgi:hypothetical protein
VPEFLHRKIIFEPKSLRSNPRPSDLNLSQQAIGPNADAEPANVERDGELEFDVERLVGLPEVRGDEG